ncbi:hypothetical protein [Psychromonas arctica]|uniref:hypothetical protein n=1 Tax=Psychromonas arctica TaxID=168275 RepID=UPI002FCF2014
MAALGLTIHHACKLTPITEEELMEYSYYAINNLNFLAKTATGGFQSLIEENDWEASIQQKEMVVETNLWKTLKLIWEYAEKGMNLERIKSEYHMDDLLTDLYKWSSACNSTLLYDGHFGHEKIEVRESSIKLAYKFLARLKLDFEFNILDELPSSGLYPVAHSTMLTTVEYSLLAGLSHIGAVRNEVCKIKDPLVIEKEGGNILITIPVARKFLQKKRKFISTEGIDYGQVN